MAEAVHVGSPGVVSTLDTLRASGITGERALAVINRMVDSQAFMLAANDIFFASALLFLALIPLIWLTRPERAPEGVEAAAGAH